jgi:hypothetical protein
MNATTGSHPYLGKISGCSRLMGAVLLAFFRRTDPARAQRLPEVAGREEGEKAGSRSVETTWSKSEVVLGEREVVSYASGEDTPVIVCTEGRLWITQEGDPQDYLLLRGETFVPRKRGKVVVQRI